MLLGIHTYSLHLHGIGPTDICGSAARPKAMDILGLMDYALKIGIDGLHITPTDCGGTEEANLREIGHAAREKGGSRFALRWQGLADVAMRTGRRSHRRSSA